MPSHANHLQTEALELAASKLKGLAAGHPSARFELYLEGRASTRIDARHQKIDTLTRSQDLGLSIRVLKNQRMGFSFTTALSASAIERAALAAWEIADFMPEDPHHALPDFNPAAIEATGLKESVDSRGSEVAIDQKVRMALDLEARCLAADPRVRAVRSAQFSETLNSCLMLDTAGRLISHRATTFSASISCKAEDGGDSRMGGDHGFAGTLDALDLSTVANRAAISATELLGAGTAPTLTCPAVLRNDVVADLMDFLSASFSAEQVDRGRSMLSITSIGRPIFSPAITLVDDGLLKDGLATSPFDGEGQACSTNELISAGVVRKLLCDGYHARKLGIPSTGSASRGIKSPPSISTSNLFIKPGSLSLQELCAGIKKGVLIADLMGLHTANPVTGDFSLGASGFLIEDGMITRPMSGFAVAGNVLGLLGKVEALGNDFRFFGSNGAPSARVTELSIGGNST